MIRLLSEQNQQIRDVYSALQADPEEAQRQAKELVNKNDKALVVSAKQALSNACLQMGDLRAAADYAQQSGVVRAIVEVHLASGQFDEARSRVADEAKRFSASKDAKGEASMLLLQVDICAAEGDVDQAASMASKASEMYQKMGAKDKDHSVGCSLLTLAEYFASAWQVTDASKSAQTALEVFKKLGDKFGEGAALQTQAKVSMADGKNDEALAKAGEALTIFEGLGNAAAHEDALRTKIAVLIADNQGPLARSAAKEAAALLRSTSDARGEASAQLLVADVCVQTMQAVEAVAAAKRASTLYKELNSRVGQAAALSAVAAADFDNELGEAKLAVEQRIALYKEMGDAFGEAEAYLSLADMHVANLGRKITRCIVASPDDTIAALGAAKQAHTLFARSGQDDGLASAMRVVATVLMYNKVPQHMVESASSPDEVLQGVMNAKYSNAENALPRESRPADIKLDKVVPSSRALDRQRFGWNKPLNGYTYTLIWQPARDREVGSRTKKQSYDIACLNSGTRTTSAPTLIQARSADAAERATPLCVYMVSTDAKSSYATNLMTIIQTIGAMITAKLPKLTFVQFDETWFEWTDTKTRQMNIYPAVLGLIRSSRLEAPNVTVGYVGGDAASWIADPAPMINNIFETLECDESEMMYKCGDAYAPLLVSRQIEDATKFVKAHESGFGR